MDTNTTRERKESILITWLCCVILPRYLEYDEISMVTFPSRVGVRSVSVRGPPLQCSFYCIASHSRACDHEFVFVCLFVLFFLNVTGLGKHGLCTFQQTFAYVISYIILCIVQRFCVQFSVEFTFVYICIHLYLKLQIFFHKSIHALNNSVTLMHS